MENNVGGNDRLIRIIGGTILGVLALNALIDSCIKDIYSPIFGSLSLVFLYTALSQKCICNRLMGVNTSEDED